MPRTDYVFTLAGYLGPVVVFCHNEQDLAARARGYESRPGFLVLYVSPCEVRAAWDADGVPGTFNDQQEGRDA